MVFYIMIRFTCTALAVIIGWIADLSTEIPWPASIIISALMSLLAMVTLYIGWSAR